MTMASGRPVVDSSVPVTTQINGASLLDLAEQLFDETPVLWGRYFTSTAATGNVEYRHLL
jgi:hypothetical protein